VNYSKRLKRRRIRMSNIVATKVKSTELPPQIIQNIAKMKKRVTTELPSKIKTQGEYETLVEVQGQANSLIKEITKWFDEIIKPIKASAKALDEQKKKTLFEPEAWNRQAKDLLEGWFIIQEKKRLEAEEALREKLEEEAEALRKIEVKALKKEGLTESAALLKEAPLQIPKVALENTAKVDGVSFRTDYEIEVTDLSKVPEEYIIRSVDMTKVRAFARETKGESQVPGLSIKAIKTMVRR
jgi:hypothetical protein